jgi:DNA topoisomerase-1
MVVKEGRFGPYVTDGDTNASLRVGDEPATLSPERGAELLQGRRDAIANGEVGKRPAKKAAKKVAKKTAKKATKKATKKRAPSKATTAGTVKEGAPSAAAEEAVPEPGGPTA